MEKRGEELGYRKYLRSLSETKGSREDISILEEQIEFFSKSIAQVAGQIEYCNKLLGCYLKEQEMPIAALQNWSSFLKKESREQSLLLEDTLKKAEVLHRVNKKSKLSKITLDIDSDASLQSKEQGSHLVTAFHSLITYCDQRKLLAKIKIKLRTEETKKRLILTCEGHERSGYEELQNQSLELSKKLFKKFTVSQELIELDRSSFLISLEWTQQKEKDAHKASSLNY